MSGKPLHSPITTRGLLVTFIATICSTITIETSVKKPHKNPVGVVFVPLQPVNLVEVRIFVVTEVQEAHLAYGPSTVSSSTLSWPKAGEAVLVLASRDFGGLLSIPKELGVSSDSYLCNGKV